MRSLWGKLSRPSSLNTEPANEPTNNNLEPQDKPLMIDYYNLREIQKKASSINSIEMFPFPNAQVASTYEDVMSTLKGLLNVIQSLKEQVQKNKQKLTDYERLKSLIGKHSNIVSQLQQQSSSNLSRLYKQKREIQQKLNDEVKILSEKQLQQSKKIFKLQNQILQKSQRITNLTVQIECKTTKIKELQKELTQQKEKLVKLTEIEDSSIKFDKKMYQIDKFEVSRLLVYSKLRKYVYSFISAHDFTNLSLANKQINYICCKTLKKQFIGIMMKNHTMKIQKLQKQFKEYEKIYDNFPAENIRNNAIKYLFFKIKPGGYMLPYFQNDQQQNIKIQEKSSSKLIQLSNFFKKKNENQQLGKEKVLTYESLKNDHDFKEIQKRVQTFFDKLFGIEAASDLKVFNETMKRQLSQLKIQLKSTDKNMHLLCMSKYLYLEMNELNNLLQVCFALLIHYHNDIKEYKQKNIDLKQSDKVLRNLVENIANDREQIEKRIFFLENQNLKYQNNQQKQDHQILILRELQKSRKKQHEQTTIKLQEIKIKLDGYQKRQKQWLNNWQQVQNLIKQASFQN